MSNIKKTFGNKTFSFGGGGGGATSVPVITIINGSDRQAAHGIDMVRTISGAPMTILNITGAAENYVDGSIDFPNGIAVGRLATDGSIQFICNMNPYLPFVLYAGDRFISTSTVNISGGMPPGETETGYTIKAYVPEVIL